ncbi:TolC family outer membrane protein [Halodesulfovibrio marinisediminis]|uniref:Outer membrane protein, adhesin transport system n=1 Tax=Halodesulfovibrio marinisediminis DSM 17456 TaxID=1121457 RepID=A0A1N6GLL1_9BACT|nr:TolC family outer membrane protein [Halodesulfovibrio marinisediminis]SIO08413.1 outer membrane protein, adhesin transport system [Halodesulfovibrio marinisediminis DSM 17456]
MKKIYALLAMTAVLFGCASVASAEISLKDSVLATLKTYPRIAALESQSKAAKQDSRSAWGGYLPDVDATGSYGPTQHSSVSTRNNGTEYMWRGAFEGAVSITQLIYDGRFTQSRVERTEAAYQSSQSQILDAAERFGLDAVIAHLTVIRDKALVELAEDNAQQYRDILASMQELVDAGGGSVADLTLTQGRLARALATLATQRSELEIAIAQYKRLTGVEPEGLMDVEISDAAPVDIETALMRMRSENPRLDTRKYEIDVAQGLIDERESYYYPRISGKGSYNYTEDMQGVDDYATDFRFAVVGSWNLFNGGSDLADTRAAVARKESAREDYRDTIDDLYRQVASTWSEQQAAYDQVEQYNKAVGFNVETRDVYAQQFTVGQRTLLDVLDAENELFITRGRLVTSKINVLIASYRLLALGGGLVSSFDIEATDYISMAE